MKIRNKLTLLFTVIVAIILIGLNFYIYILNHRYTVAEFYSQLEGRANIASTLFLEKDEETASIIQTFQKKYLRSLPDETIRIYEENNHPVFIDSTDEQTFKKELIEQIRKSRIYKGYEHDKQLLGILYPDNQGNFVIIVSALDENGRSRDKQLLSVLVLGFVISIIIVFIAGRFFTKLMFQPITAITEQSNTITETNLHLRLSEGNKTDEIAELSMTINSMLDRLEHAFELQRSFVNNASHELRTPLTSIIGSIEVTLSKARTVEEHQTVLKSILAEADKLQKLSNGLLNLAQSNADFSGIKKEEVRIDELLLEITNMERLNREQKIVELAFPDMPDDPESLVVFGNRSFLEVALLNLLDNACKFSDGKKVKLSLHLESGKIIVKIIDHGIGIAAEELSDIKETFYRAKNAHGYPGSGIGLALADRIIRIHGGQLEILSMLRVGTEVSVLLPNSRKH